MKTLAAQVITPEDLLIHWQGHRKLTRNLIEKFPEKDFFEFSIGGMRTFAQLTDELLAIAAPALKGIVNKKERHDQILYLLQQTNLLQHKDKAVYSFSGGMRQRFGIAQALLGNPKIIIVDEPTAGLDPEERNRFNNLLSEIGESIIVVLSTHIVEDVRDLCPKMAIISNGKLILEGKPNEAIDSLKDKIWMKAIQKTELKEHQSNFNIISCNLNSGKINIHVFSDQRPDSGFELISPDLSDVYFSVLAQNQLKN